MPRLPDHPCAFPGCPKLVPRGKKYCGQHSKERPEEVRSSAALGYDSRWRKAAKLFLNQHPLCAECLKHGKCTVATDVDHVIPHRGDKKLFWDVNNWQPLCHSCHSTKTAKEDHNVEYRY